MPRNSPLETQSVGRADRLIGLIEKIRRSRRRTFCLKMWCGTVQSPNRLSKQRLRGSGCSRYDWARHDPEKTTNTPRQTKDNLQFGRHRLEGLCRFVKEHHLDDAQVVVTTDHGRSTPITASG
jgi:hypothetical protein